MSLFNEKTPEDIKDRLIQKNETLDITESVNQDLYN
jgi:hypothetical protein